MSNINVIGVTYNDVQQAVLAALMFGEDAGFAAMVAIDAGTPKTIYPAANVVVHLSSTASFLLADAQSVSLDFRKDGLDDYDPNHINHYYFDRDADEAADIDMSEVTPGNTEKVYRDQPIPEREA